MAITIWTLLLIATLPLAFYRSRLNLHWAEVVAIPILVGASSVLVPLGLDTMTDGRAAFGETLPWTLVVSLAAAGLWIIARRRRSPPRNVSAMEIAVPPAQVPTRGASAPRAARADVHTVFVSYRRSDSADVTGRIYDRLAQRFGGERVFKDVDSIPLGVDFRKYVGDLVGRCDALIAVIGRQWLQGDSAGARRVDDPRDLVRVEIGSALTREIPVIPVLVAGAAIPNADELPEELRDLAYRNGVPIRPDPDFHKDVDRLIAGLEQHFRS